MRRQCSWWMQGGDLKGTVLSRLDELHAVMAALRALGKSLENSGIDDAWIEADVCGSATTRLKCAHYKRSLRGHVHMYMALYELLLDTFFKEKPHIKSICSKAVNELQEVCARSAARRSTSMSAKCITIANEHLLQTWGLPGAIEIINLLTYLLTSLTKQSLSS